MLLSSRTSASVLLCPAGCSPCPTGTFANSSELISVGCQCYLTRIIYFPSTAKLECSLASLSHCYPGECHDKSFCTPCSLGHYNNQTNKTTCQPCPVGMFGNTTGLATCHECLLGESHYIVIFIEYTAFRLARIHSVVMPCFYYRHLCQYNWITGMHKLYSRLFCRYYRSIKL